MSEDFEDDWDERDLDEEHEEKYELISEYQNDYNSLLACFNERFIQPFISQKKIKRRTLKRLVDETINISETRDFSSIPFHIRDAYLRLRQLALTTLNASKDELVYQLELFEGLGKFCTSCADNLILVSEMRVSNPCRNHQYDLIETIEGLEKDLGKTPLTKSAKDFLNNCRRCPYKNQI